MTAIEFKPEKRKINKTNMFVKKDLSLERWNTIYNAYVKALVEYNIEKAKAYQELLSDIKRLGESAGITDLFK